jgi:prostamide/prostaglandin F2alpha synthase
MRAGSVPPMRRLLGAAVKRQKTRPPDDASGLADLTVKDLGGHDVRLGSFWRDGPAVLVFLRHYG